MKNAKNILVSLFEWAVDLRAMERYTALFQTKAGSKKFLDDLQRLNRHFKTDAVFKDIDELLMGRKCMVFREGYQFGQEFDSMSEALSELEILDAWLIVSIDSKVAIYRPESYFDSTIMIKHKSLS